MNFVLVTAAELRVEHLQVINTGRGHSFLRSRNTGEYVIEKHSCVYTHTHSHMLAHMQKVCGHTHTLFLDPAGVLISPQGCVSVDPKTLQPREVRNFLSLRL